MNMLIEDLKNILDEEKTLLKNEIIKDLKKPILYRLKAYRALKFINVFEGFICVYEESKFKSNDIFKKIETIYDINIVNSEFDEISYSNLTNKIRTYFDYN